MQARFAALKQPLLVTALAATLFAAFARTGHLGIALAAAVVFGLVLLGSAEGWRRDAAVVGGLAILLRLPFLAGVLTDSGTLRIARSLTDPTVSTAGIPFGYVALGRLAGAAHPGDPALMLTALAIAAGTLAVVSTALAARVLAGVWTGRLAAVLVIAGPVLWSTSAVAGPRIFAALASALLGLGLVLLLAGRRRSAILVLLAACAAATAVPNGLVAKNDLTPFVLQLAWMAPLAVVGLWRAARGRGPGGTRVALVVWLAAAGAYALVRQDAAAALALTPPVAVLATLPIAGRLLRLRGHRPTFAHVAFVGGPAVAASIAALFFLIGTGPYTAAKITRHDQELRARIAYVRAAYRPGEVLLLGQKGFQQARFYLPAHEAARFRADDRPGVEALQTQLLTHPKVAWLDNSWRARPQVARKVQLSNGYDLRIGSGPAVGATLASTLAAVPDDQDDDPAE